MIGLADRWQWGGKSRGKRQVAGGGEGPEAAWNLGMEFS